MNYSQFINTEQKQNLYIFCGDGFLINKCLTKLKIDLKIFDDLQISYFDTDNFSCKNLILSCEQVSFFGEKRVVVLKNLEKINETDKKELQNYIKNLNPLCVLCLIDSYNNGIFDYLKIEKVELKSLSETQLHSFVFDKLKAKNKQIDEGAYSILARACNNDMTKLEIEIDKLCAYCLDKNKIEESDIKKLVIANEEIIIYELTTALGQKNAQESLSILFKLMGSPDDNAKLFSLMSTTFQRMFFALLSKESDLQLATKMGIKEYAVKKLRQQTKNFTQRKLKKIVEEICETEYNIKSGKMTSENALYYIVLFIVSL